MVRDRCSVNKEYRVYYWEVIMQQTISNKKCGDVNIYEGFQTFVIPRWQSKPEAWK